MDADQVLMRLLALAQDFQKNQELPHHLIVSKAQRMANALIQLDEYLAKGGVCPERWKESMVEVLPRDSRAAPCPRCGEMVEPDGNRLPAHGSNGAFCDAPALDAQEEALERKFSARHEEGVSDE